MTDNYTTVNLTTPDFKEILNLSNQYLLDFSRLGDQDYQASIQKTGFFIAPLKLEDLKKDKDRLLLGIKNKGLLLAYIWVTTNIDKHEYSWLDQKSKSKIYRKKVYYIKKIAVRSTHQGLGLASILIENLNQYLNDSSLEHFTASVSFSPIKNHASVRLFEKHGFRQVAISPKVPYMNFVEY